MQNVNSKTIYYCESCRLMAIDTTPCSRCGSESFNLEAPPAKLDLKARGYTTTTLRTHRFDAC
jgi:predicted RNA-binding protein with PUA domain